MSLVNDALRRAKDTAPKSATPAVGPMRLAENTQHSRGSAFLMAMLILVILLLAGLLLWQWFYGSGGELKVRANVLPTVSKVVAAPTVSQELPIPAQSVPETTPVAETSDKPVAATADKAIATNLTAVEPSAPATITYKLQSVVYLPRNPSAVINGKMVFVDNSVDGARVVAIGPGTASIVTSAGQTNVLVMP